MASNRLIVSSLMFFAILLSTIAIASQAFGQSGTVDLTFNAVPSNPLPTDR